MKAPVRLLRGRLSYTGRLPRASFMAWADSRDGRLVIDRLASGIRLAPFGRVRTARSRLWRQVDQSARAPLVASAIQRELDAYLPRLHTLAYASDLPRMSVELRRLVVVPRLLLNGEMHQQLDLALQSEPLFGVDDTGTPLRDWFILTVIRSVEAAVAVVRPSPSRPASVSDEWMAVGVNETFQWRIPFGGQSWPGHYHLLELRPIAITRAVRTATRKAIEELDPALESLSGLHRTAILRTAAELLAPNVGRGERRTGT